MQAFCLDSSVTLTRPVATQISESEVAGALAYYLRDYEPVRDANVLPEAANALAEVLGLMRFYRVRELSWAGLTEEQQALLRAVFDQTSTLPLEFLKRVETV
jgi:hypothetical protein